MPRALPGTIFTTAFLAAQIGWIGVILLCLRRDRRKAHDGSEVSTAVGSDVDELEKNDIEAVASTPYEIKKEKE